MAINTGAFSGVITDTIANRGSSVCITIRVTGNGHLWPGDKLHIYKGDALRGSFQVKEYAFQMEWPHSSKPTIMRLFSDDAMARQAQPGEEIRSWE